MMIPILRLCSRVVKTLFGNPWLRLLSVIALAIIFYDEWFSYYIQSLSWPSLDIYDKSSKHFKLLVVADAQIIGERHENGLFGILSRFDSDRYLKKTFNLAKNHVKPDMYIFLGDNFDEGSIATDNEYKRYSHRFLDIFNTDNTTYLSVPGDNDIGGEGVDFITKEKVDRFNELFGANSNFVYTFTDFLKVDGISRDSASLNFPPKSSNLRVVLSHIPVLVFQDHFASKVIDRSEANLVISGHDHSSHIIAVDRKSGNILLDRKWDSHKFFTYSLSDNIDSIIEIIVPTCSYRMGVSRMGFGVLVIESTGRIHYAVLWSKPRLPLLLVYLAYVFVIILFMIGWMVRAFFIFLTHLINKIKLDHIV